MIILTIIWLVLSLVSAIDIADYNYINTFSILLWLSSFLIFIRRNSEFGILSVFFLIAFSSSGAINVYAENNVWMSEIQRFTYLTGSTTRILCCAYFLMLGSYICFTSTSSIRFIYSSLSDSVNKFARQSSLIIILSIIFLLLAVRVIYGSPNDHGMDRFDYWEKVAPAWAGYCKFILQHLSMLMGVMYATTKKRIYIYLIAMSLAAQILVGDKFSGMYISVLFFMIPVVIINGIDLWKKLFTTKIIVGSIVFVCIIITTSYLSYYAISGGGDAIGKLTNRIVLQSQMWWAVDADSSGNMLSIQAILTNMLGFGADKTESGIRYLMYIIAPYNLWSIFMDRDVTFTMASPVNYIFFFGFPLSVLASFIFGIMMGFAFRIISDSLKSKDVFLSVMSAKLYYILISIYTMGDVNLIFDIKSLLCVASFFIYSLISCFINRNNITTRGSDGA